MFVHNLNPVIFSVGWFELRWYSVFYALGFLFAFWFLKYARKYKAHELSDTDLSDYIVYLVLGVVIGARVFEVVVWNPSYYFSNPSQILAVWRGGLSFHGGLVGAIVGTYLFCRKKGVAFVKMLDLITIPAALALSLGRLGNFFNAELVGVPTSVPWCVEFPRYDGCRHPSQLYGMVGRFFTAGVLFFLWKKKQLKEGMLAVLFLILLGVGRFVADFWRADPRFFALSMGQWLSLVMVLIAFVCWRRIK